MCCQYQFEIILYTDEIYRIIWIKCNLKLRKVIELYYIIVLNEKSTGWDNSLFFGDKINRADKPCKRYVCPNMEYILSAVWPAVIFSYNRVKIQQKSGGVYMAKGENIFKRKDGRWEARYVKGRDHAGKIRYGFCYGKTYAEAKAKVTEAKSRVLNGEDQKSAGTAKKFSSYCDCWLELRSTQLKISSYVKYQNCIQNHIKPFLGELRLQDITTEKISAFSKYLLDEKGLSIKSVRDILSCTRSIISYINREAEGLLSRVEVIYPREMVREIRVLTEQEESDLVLYLAKELDFGRFAVYLALRTGMRIGEICALRWKDISLSKEIISVNSTVQRIKNTDPSGNSKTLLMLGSPKSGKSRRTIPLMSDIAALCRQFYQDDPECFVLTGNERCMEPRRLQRYLKKYARECNIEGIHFHTLRHTFATRCIEVGFDVKTLSEILGHASISVTLERYVHPSLDLKKENMKRLKIMDCFSDAQSDAAVKYGEEP